VVDDLVAEASECLCVSILSLIFVVKYYQRCHYAKSALTFHWCIKLIIATNLTPLLLNSYVFLMAMIII